MTQKVTLYFAHSRPDKEYTVYTPEALISAFKQMGVPEEDISVDDRNVIVNISIENPLLRFTEVSYE